MKKKFIKVLMVTSSICALMPFSSLSASAVKNNWDSKWTGGSGYCGGQYPGINSYCESKNTTSGTKRACSIRDKGDDSSIYVYNKSSKTVEVKVWGESDWLFPVRYDITWCDGYKKISTSEWKVPRYSERFIPQYINEREFKYAHVHFTTSGTNGLWSADSSGWYPNADPIVTHY